MGLPFPIDEKRRQPPTNSPLHKGEKQFRTLCYTTLEDKPD